MEMSTAMLIAVAETAQDIAAGLNEFLDAVPECSTEITALISECFAISSALRELSTAIGDYRYNRQFELIEEDVRTIRLSLDYTFEDVERCFGGLGVSTYREVWRDIDHYFQTESGNTLVARLEHYRNFLIGLTRISARLVLTLASSITVLVFNIYSREPLNHREYQNLKGRIAALLEVQQNNLVDGINNLSLGDSSSSPPNVLHVQTHHQLELDRPYLL